MPTDEILTLEIEPPYIGSAVSPTVDIAETTDDITVTITDFRGEHSYTVEKTDQAIEDAEQAAQNANDTAQTVAQGWANRQNEINVTMDSMRTLMTNSANAESQRVIAENARVTAENAREQEWNELSTNATAAIDAANAATVNATSAANRADDSSRVANEMISRGNTTITNIGNAANQIFGQAGQAIGEANAAAQSATDAATLATNKAGLANTAAQNADTATTAANAAATTATTAAEQADAAREAIQDDLAAKADKDGYHPQLTAGLADTVAGGTSEVVQFAQRVSDHDGMARVESLRGNTVRWNQIATSAHEETDGYLSGNYYYVSFVVNIGKTSDHKYMLSCDIKLSAGSSGFLYFTDDTEETKVQPFNDLSASYKHISAILTANVTVTNGTRFGFRADKRVIGDNVTVTAKNGQVYDLTAMFGAGNEPATVAEFEALFPDAYYPYDAGSLQSVNVEGIQSAGTTRTIPASTYFPNGLCSAGTAYDELDFANHKAITRIGSRAYESGDESDASVITDGTTTQYALATPTETALPENLQATYPVETGGTESIVIPTGNQSAPPTMVIVYGYTADGVRDETQSIVAPVEHGVASSNYAVGAYLVMGGTLYRVTTAIATGETINPGTNCTATTVMAEIIRLTA